MSCWVNHTKMFSFPFIGEAALGSMYLFMKSWSTISESLKSLSLLSFACLWTLPKVSLKSSSHHTDRFTSWFLHKYLGDQAYIHSVWPIIVILGSNTRQKGWFWGFVCDMKSKHLRRCKQQRMGKCFWMFCIEGSR